MKHICNKKLIPVYLLIFYIIYYFPLLLILILIPFPFSKSYTVSGVFLNIYTDSQNSMMVFLPYNGYKYAKKYITESGLPFKEGDIIEYLNETEHAGKVFAVKSKESISENNPQCSYNMPEISQIMTISHNKSSDSTYEFHFKFNIPKEVCINIVYLYIHCNYCVQNTNGQNKTYNSSISESKNSFLITYGKENITDYSLPDFNTQTNMTLNVTEFKYTLLLNTKKNSKDYLKFLESFGEASVNFATSLPADTIYKYEGNYKI